MHLFLKGNVGFYLCSFGLMFLSAKQTVILVIKDSEARSADVKRNSFLIRCVDYCFLFNKTDLICKFFCCCYFFLPFKIFFLSTLSHMEEVSNVKSVRRMLSFLLVSRKPSCVF